MADKSSLTYLGHMSFLWKSLLGNQILIDPFQQPNDNRSWFVIEYPKLHVDVVLITHDHFDHNELAAVKSAELRITTPGITDIPGARIIGVQDLHAPFRSCMNMPNVMFVIEMEGIRYCHIGDNRADIPEKELMKLGDIDVLIVPIDDSSHLHRFNDIENLVELIDPKLIIPSHYYIDGITDPLSTLKPITNWIENQKNVVFVNNSKISIDKNHLPFEKEIWVLDADLKSQ